MWSLTVSVRGYGTSEIFFTAQNIFSWLCSAAQCPLPDVGSSSDNPFDPGQHYVRQINDVSFCVEFKTMWEDTWWHNIIFSDLSKENEGEKDFGFHQYNYESDWHPNTLGPVVWGCILHWQHICKGVNPPLTSVLDMTQNNLMVRLQ